MSPVSNSPEEMLQSILSDPETINKISSIFGSLGSDEKSDKTESLGDMPISPEMIMRISSMYNKISNEDDPRVNLLLALLPYMNEKRKNNTQQAIKLLKMSKMSSLLGELNIL